MPPKAERRLNAVPDSNGSSRGLLKRLCAQGLEDGTLARLLAVDCGDGVGGQRGAHGGDDGEGEELGKRCRFVFQTNTAQRVKVAFVVAWQPSPDIS